MDNNFGLELLTALGGWLAPPVASAVTYFRKTSLDDLVTDAAVLVTGAAVRTTQSVAAAATIGYNPAKDIPGYRASIEKISGDDELVNLSNQIAHVVAAFSTTVSPTQPRVKEFTDQLKKMHPDLVKDCFDASLLGFFDSLAKEVEKYETNLRTLLDDVTKEMVENIAPAGSTEEQFTYKSLKEEKDIDKKNLLQKELVLKLLTNIQTDPSLDDQQRYEKLVKINHLIIDCDLHEHVTERNDHVRLGKEVEKYLCDRFDEERILRKEEFYFKFFHLVFRPWVGFSRRIHTALSNVEKSQQEKLLQQECEKVASDFFDAIFYHETPLGTLGHNINVPVVVAPLVAWRVRTEKKELSSVLYRLLIKVHDVRGKKRDLDTFRGKGVEQLCNSIFSKIWNAQFKKEVSKIDSYYNQVVSRFAGVPKSDQVPHMIEGLKKLFQNDECLISQEIRELAVSIMSEMPLHVCASIVRHAYPEGVRPGVEKKSIYRVIPHEMLTITHRNLWKIIDKVYHADEREFADSSCRKKWVKEFRNEILNVLDLKKNLDARFGDLLGSFKDDKGVEKRYFDKSWNEEETKLLGHLEKILFIKDQNTTLAVLAAINIPIFVTLLVCQLWMIVHHVLNETLRQVGGTSFVVAKQRCDAICRELLMMALVYPTVSLVKKTIEVYQNKMEKSSVTTEHTESTE